jgi:Domain of Unknown Function (DUF928)
MLASRGLRWLVGATVLFAVPAVALAQTGTPAPAAPQGEALPAYKPPPRGAPGGRVGGASRGTYRTAAPLPRIEPLAPEEHTGLSANPAPDLYFYASGPVYWPTRFTISEPMQPAPVIDAAITPPRSAGIYVLHVADYHVRLRPGVIYTWSVAAIIDPKARSRDLVATASLMLGTPDPAVAAAVRAAPPVQRADLFAQAGFWYDAVSAAAEAAPSDRDAALDALMSEVGLITPAPERHTSAGEYLFGADQREARP